MTRRRLGLLVSLSREIPRDLKIGGDSLSPIGSDTGGERCRNQLSFLYLRSPTAYHPMESRMTDVRNGCNRRNDVGTLSAEALVVPVVKSHRDGANKGTGRPIKVRG